MTEEEEDKILMDLFQTTPFIALKILADRMRQLQHPEDKWPITSVYEIVKAKQEAREKVLP